MTRKSEAKDPERMLGERKRVEAEVEGHIVYILECSGGWLYVGCTNNLLRRWAEHQRGGARFTKGLGPFRVIHVEACPTRSEAERRERQLKGWTRAKKWALAKGDLAC